MSRFTARIEAFNDKAKRNVDPVLCAAAQEVFRRATQRQPIVKETGTFVTGKIPVDKGHLVGTSEVRINGASIATGGEGAKTPPDYAVVIASLEGGETVKLVFTADYARAIEYGTGSIAGRFFVRMAVADW